MFPLILVSKNESEIDIYIGEFIKKNNYPAYSIIKVYPQNKEITIDQIREIRKDIRVSSIKRLFIIYFFDTSSGEAQNAFLKTLEDHTSVNQFILTVQNEENVLSTVKSRAKLIYLDREFSNKNISSDSEENKKKNDVFIKGVMNDSDYKFLNDPMITALSKEQTLLFIDQIILYFRDKIKNGSTNQTSIIKESFKLKKLVQNNNLNPQLALDNLLIFIKKILK